MTEPESPRSRLVAIVGRPNVGKSAIFNRLAGRRMSIVHAESGVTRDRVILPVQWQGRRFELVDTGGLANLEGERTTGEIEEGIRRQADCALRDAAVVIFVTDIAAGLHPLDEHVALRLRRSGGVVLLAANKADTDARDVSTADFSQLGFPVFPVSALHNRGFDALMERVLRALPEAPDTGAANALKVAVVGRPNVGKSSYVNRLLRDDRVIVSPVPGTTRDSIEVPFTIGEGADAQHYLLIDTAGLRAGSKVDSVVERFSRFRTEDSVKLADVVVLVLDAGDGPTAQDKKVAS